VSLPLPSLPQISTTAWLPLSSPPHPDTIWLGREK
jgi:hypothetical protein